MSTDQHYSPDFLKHIENLKTIVHKSLNPEATFSCPYCNAFLKYEKAYEHYASHIDVSNLNVLEKLLLIQTNLKRTHKKIETKDDKLSRETKKMINDKKQSGRGVVEDGMLPSSNLRKIDRNKRRK